MIVPGLRTPRITAHRCVASRTTPSPAASRSCRKFRDLLRRPLLDLEPTGVHLDDARDLRQADDPARGISAAAAVPENGSRWCSRGE